MRRGDIYCAFIFSGITAILIMPTTHKIFIAATNTYPYIMGFIKFAILATMGELLVIRIGAGSWNKPPGVIYKAVVWGIVGMMIVLMFSIFSNGVIGAAKANLLFIGNGALGILLTAFFTSTIMNLTFAPVFMAAHRISDTYIDMKVENRNIKVTEVITAIDWPGFIKFVVGKTVPFIWIPAHTVTFMLPPIYRVIIAAYLSIVLGVVLAYARRQQTKISF